MTDSTEGRAALMLIAQVVRIIDDQARAVGGTGVLDLMDAGLAPIAPEPADLADARRLARGILQALGQARALARADLPGPAN